MDKNKPLVSAQELDALIAGWGDSTSPVSVDKFFPIRIFILFALSSFSAIALLFFTDNIVQILHSNSQVSYIKNYMYFRGWFLLIFLAIGISSYRTGKYVAINYLILFILGSMSFISDLFTVYPERLQNITPGFTLVLLVRLVLLWFLFLNIKNASRIPEKRSRFDVLLPFRRGH
jgi:hypothetical protein